ncbi:hypothetical protein ACJX0J_026565, partial [Zea mays]
FPSSIEISAMDDFSMISDHSMLLQGHGMLGAEGCLGTRGSSGVLPTGGRRTVPVPALQLQDDRNNKGEDMFFSDWPELASFDDLEASLRNFDPTFEIGSSYFDDMLWPSNCSPGAQLARNGYSDDIDFSIDQKDSNSTPKVNTTKTKQQSRRNGASGGSSGTASNHEAHASSSSGLSDAELFLHPFDDTTALASQTWEEDLQAILCSIPETRAVVPAASTAMCADGSSTCCSGPDIVAAHHVPRSATATTKDAAFSGSPDTILEEMAENPLDMYFPPLPTTSGQSGTMMMSDTTWAPEHRFREEFAGSCALGCAELRFCSEDVASAGVFHKQPGSATAVVLDAVPVKDLSFQKLQHGMNQLDLATRGRIRDSLYRLANRLEQTHCVARTSGRMGSN